MSREHHLPRQGETIEHVSARAFTIPTDRPEADGTLSWNSTTIVVVEVAAAGSIGLGYTYANAAIASLIDRKLGSLVAGEDALAIGTINAKLWRSVRNLGKSGLVSCAISAIDIALWDLKARLLGITLADLLGPLRYEVSIYGSGGFTSYDDDTLRKQLGTWVTRDGCDSVKMKIGSDPKRDPLRVTAAREAIGGAHLFVDANGAFTPRGALRQVSMLRAAGVTWFEEPVSSDDRKGMAFVRRHMDRAIDVAAGEYSFTLDDSRLMLNAGAVDVLQADITRCGGVSGFLQVASLCAASHVDLSAHCAPAAHLHVACAVPRFRNLEWFHDHVRIEAMLFEGAPVAVNGAIALDRTRLGHGLAFRKEEAERYAV